ncbi:LAQU0S26e00672g1_1 [Lachancea quebecensis]|uniref:LAQU0S26e00672g1_1 n=1 Tax=Lachancea quebecensis TaxID=1654605 RepID=A0A0P1KXS3_9SACH|nr:LAQU0S26e00672g1_1 [Lachancea quebecensis]
MGKSLTCLIVGETPATQFLAWRLSLSNEFIILVSSNISSDGLVSWKSPKLGSNFYRPNEFAKGYEELGLKLEDTDGNKRYSIDVIILSCLSFPSLNRYCDLLSRYSGKQTIVLVDANFGVQLEKPVLDKFFGACACVLSVLCDAEARQLSSGSYALVNDSCKFYLGLTYACKGFKKQTSKHDRLSANLQCVQNTFSDENSTLNAMVAQLEGTNVDSIVKLAPEESCEMALKVWEHIIPRISLHILSIVFEQFDYDKLLENSSSRFIFEDLVRELSRICYAQCGEVSERYLKSKTAPRNSSTSTDDWILELDFDKVLEETKQRKRQMDRSTINEYPEFLTLSFEAYCFYHRLEFPAHILLHQPIQLASGYHVNYSSINFLYGFYSRLLAISGFSIEGEPNKVSAPSLLFGIRAQLTSQSEQTLVSKHSPSGDKNALGTGSKAVGVKSKLKAKFKRIGHGNKETLNGAVCSVEDPALTDEGSGSSLDNFLAGDVHDRSSTDPEDPGEAQVGRDFMFWCNEAIQDANSEPEVDDNDNSSIVDELIRLPNFRKRDFRKQGMQMDLAPTVVPLFEQEIRNDPFAMSRYYFDAYKLGDPKTFLSLKESDPRPASARRIQRRYRREYAGVAGMSTLPENLFRDHVDLLKRVNMGGILSVTTSRYGHVDSSQKMLDNWNRGLGYLKTLALRESVLQPGASCHVARRSPPRLQRHDSRRSSFSPEVE